MSGFSVRYHPLVQEKDLPRLGAADKERIRKAIESKLFTAPEKYAKPLQSTLKGYWSLRSGDWRIIFKLQGKEIYVLCIGHRKDVYQVTRRRES